MKAFAIGCIAFLSPLSALAQARYWENWNKYSARYDYGPSTTYVNLRSRVVISQSPRMYSFEARIAEEGVSPEQEYRILVNCSSKATMYLSSDSSNKWAKATGKFTKIVADACK